MSPRVRIGGRTFGGAPVIAGVVNVSLESPNAHSVARGPREAVERARRLRDDGAAIIDLGGRSSNFAAPDAGWREELRRVVPAVEALKQDGFLVSVDTWSPAVMRAAAGAGADVIKGAPPKSERAAAGRNLCRTGVV